MALKATEVFVPGAYPQYTYIERAEDGFETTLRDALATPGQIISLSGPSKSGKTVLVEKVVSRDLLITVSGAGIGGPEEIWDRVLDWMQSPTSVSSTKTIAGQVSLEAGGKISGGMPLIVKGEGSVTSGAEIGAEVAKEAVRERSGLHQVQREIANSDFVVLLDDFHYMPRSVQEDVARAIKEAVRLGVKIVTAAVSHRGDDVVRALPELRGRVKAIDLQYWSPHELREIALRGFKLLNVEMPANVIETFVIEAAGSPQLMQLLCLQACFVLGTRSKTLLSQKVDVTADGMRAILEQTSSATDFRSLVDILDSGPKTRGTERKTYRFGDDGSTGDVYRCVLKAVASDPPKLSFPYDELLARTVRVCEGESPVGSSVTGSCLQMSKLAQEKFPNERAIDWDEQKQILDIPDPYLLFYLRWSGRLYEDYE